MNTNMSAQQQLDACVKVFSNFKKASGYGIIRQYKVEDLIAVDGYTIRVEDPIDAPAIDSKLKGRLYDTPMDFVRDIRQMAANCLRFNVASINNEVRRKGRELLRWVDERMSQELPGHVERLTPETLACLDVLDFLLDGAEVHALAFWNRIDVVLQAAGIWDEYIEVIDYPCDFSTLTTQLVLRELPAEVFLGRAEKVCLNAEHFWTQRNAEPDVVKAARTLRQNLASRAEAVMPSQWRNRRVAPELDRVDDMDDDLGELELQDGSGDDMEDILSMLEDEPPPPPASSKIRLPNPFLQRANTLPSQGTGGGGQGQQPLARAGTVGGGAITFKLAPPKVEASNGPIKFNLKPSNRGGGGGGGAPSLAAVGSSASEASGLVSEDTHTRTGPQLGGFTFKKPTSSAGGGGGGGPPVGTFVPKLKLANKRPIDAGEGAVKEEGAAKKPKLKLPSSSVGNGGGGGGGLKVSLPMSAVDDDDDDVPLAALQDGAGKASGGGGGGGKAKGSGGGKKKDGARPKRERNRSKKAAAPPSLSESTTPSIDTAPSITTSVDTSSAAAAGSSWIQQQQPLIDLSPPLSTGPPVAPIARPRPPVAQRFEPWESAAKTVLEKIWKHPWVKPPKAYDPSRLPKGERDKPVPKSRYGFEEPVLTRWPELETHYHSIIDQPMDLGTVRSRLMQKGYSGPDDFLTDVDRIFTNCLTFNASQEELYIFNREVCEVARHLRVYLDALASEFFAPREGQAYEDRLFNRSLERHEALRKQREESLRQLPLSATNRSATFQAIIQFVRLLRNDREGIKAYFWEPVPGSEEFLRSYHAVIKRPMCIKQILEPLESPSGPFLRVGDVIDRLQLIVNNAVTFNSPHANAGYPLSKEVLKQAYRIQDYMDDRLQKVLLEVWEFETRLPIQARLELYDELQKQGHENFAEANVNLADLPSISAAHATGGSASAGTGQQGQGQSQRSRAPTKQPTKHAERREAAATLKLRKDRDESAEQDKAAKKLRDRRVKEEIMEEVWRHVNLRKREEEEGGSREREREKEREKADKPAGPITPGGKAEQGPTGGEQGPTAMEVEEKEGPATPLDPPAPGPPVGAPVEAVDLAPVVLGRRGGEEERRRRGRAVLEELLGGKGNVRRKEKVHARLEGYMAKELRKQLQHADSASPIDEEGEEEGEGEGMEVDEEEHEGCRAGEGGRRLVHVLCHRVDPPRWAEGEWEGGLPSLAFPPSPLLHLTVLAAAPSGAPDSRSCHVLLNGRPCEGARGRGEKEGEQAAGLKVDLGGVPVALGFGQQAKARPARGEYRAEDCTLGSLQEEVRRLINAQAEGLGAWANSATGSLRYTKRMVNTYSWMSGLSLDYSEQGRFYISRQVQEEQRGGQQWRVIHVVAEHTALTRLSVAGVACL